MSSDNFNILLKYHKCKFRKFENITIKAVKLKCSIQFNKTCLSNDLFPAYTMIYTYIYS